MHENDIDIAPVDTGIEAAILNFLTPDEINVAKKVLEIGDVLETSLVCTKFSYVFVKTVHKIYELNSEFTKSQDDHNQNIMSICKQLLSHTINFSEMAPKLFDVSCPEHADVSSAMLALCVEIVGKTGRQEDIDNMYQTLCNYSRAAYDMEVLSPKIHKSVETLMHLITVEAAPLIVRRALTLIQHYMANMPNVGWGC